MEKKLLENVIPSIKYQIPYNEIKYDINGKPIDVYFIINQIFLEILTKT